MTTRPLRTLRDVAQEAADIGDTEGAAFVNAQAAKLEALEIAAGAVSPEIVAFQRRRFATGAGAWVAVDPDDIPHYRARGHEIRALGVVSPAPAPRVTGGLEVCDECGGWGEHMSTCSAYGGGVPDATRAMTARIVAERVRQQTDEGRTPEWDDRHTTGGLARAAACYALAAGKLGNKGDRPLLNAVADCWPWDFADWKPSDDPMRDLERAGALILAEMERRARS